MRRSAAGAAGTGAVVATGAGVPASSGVPHSLQNLPVAEAPQTGHGRAIAAPHDEQNFAVSAFDASQAVQTDMAAA